MGSITDNGLYQVAKAEESGGENPSGNPPSVVVFPRQIIEVPPMKLEMEESVEDMSPQNMWQVYAFGGFMLARWIWAKWKESRGKSQ